MANFLKNKTTQHRFAGPLLALSNTVRTPGRVPVDPTRSTVKYRNLHNTRSIYLFSRSGQCFHVGPVDHGRLLLGNTTICGAPVPQSHHANRTVNLFGLMHTHTQTILHNNNNSTETHDFSLKTKRFLSGKPYRSAKHTHEQLRRRSEAFFAAVPSFESLESCRPRVVLVGGIEGGWDGWVGFVLVG